MAGSTCGTISAAGLQTIPLPGIPGSPEFQEAYAAALAGQAMVPPSVGAKRVRPGSIGALALTYFASPGFLRSRRPPGQPTGDIESFQPDHGDKPLALLTRQHINAMLAARVGKPAAANHWLRLLRTMMRFAVVEGLRKDDPTTAVAFIRRRSPDSTHGRRTRSRSLKRITRSARGHGLRSRSCSTPRNGAPT